MSSHNIFLPPHLSIFSSVSQYLCPTPPSYRHLHSHRTDIISSLLCDFKRIPKQVYLSSRLRLSVILPSLRTIPLYHPVPPILPTHNGLTAMLICNVILNTYLSRSVRLSQCSRSHIRCPVFGWCCI